MHTEFWLENLKITDYLEDLGINGMIIVEWILKEIGLGMWTGFI